MESRLVGLCHIKRVSATTSDLLRLWDLCHRPPVLLSIIGQTECGIKESHSTHHHWRAILRVTCPINLQQCTAGTVGNSFCRKKVVLFAPFQPLGRGFSGVFCFVQLWLVARSILISKDPTKLSGPVAELHHSVTCGVLAVTTDPGQSLTCQDHAHFTALIC